jgi:DNA invertase Pin-like site-specific DNA recombinase
VAVAARSSVVRAGIYARISSDRDGDQLGVKRQIEDCRREAERRGFVVEDVYVDDDVSAWSGKRRPEYERLLSDLRAGAIRAVLVYHLDRLTRGDLRVLESFVDLCDELRVELGCVTGDVDLATSTGRLTARMLGSLARYESDHKSERIRRKHEEIAADGRVSGGGSRPYGYETDKVTLRPAEAAIVAECARRFLAGEAIRAIADDLNERAVPSASGSAWSPQTLRRMLGSARIAGQREHRGEIVAEAEWPAIISHADSAQIRARLADPERRTNKSARRYLLVRLLRCSVCGERLVARPRSGGQRRYACAKGAGFSGCGKTYITAEPVEEWVTDAALARLNSAELTAALADRNAETPEAERWQQEADAAQEQLDELATAYGEREITMSEWRAARQPIEQRLTAARRQLAKLDRNSVLSGLVGSGAELAEQWDLLDLTRQHAILSALLDHVMVSPGRRGYNRFDPGRLTAVWRL